MRQAWQISSLANVLFVAFSFAVIFASEPAWGQSKERTGYVATGVGVNLKLSGNAHPYGTQFNALEVGYEFRHGLGAVASFTVGNFNYTYGSTSINSAYQMVMLGPMYLFHLNRRSSIDLKARIGYHYHKEAAQFNDGSTSGNYTRGGAVVGFLITGSYQYRVADRWTLFGNLDLSTNQVHFAPQSAPSLTTLGITAGVGFRF